MTVWEIQRQQVACENTDLALVTGNSDKWIACWKPAKYKNIENGEE